MEISEHRLKISGTVNIPEELEYQKEFYITVKGTVDEKRNKDQHDGSVIQTHILKIDVAVPPVIKEA